MCPSVPSVPRPLSRTQLLRDVPFRSPAPGTAARWAKWQRVRRRDGAEPGRSSASKGCGMADPSPPAPHPPLPSCPAESGLRLPARSLWGARFGEKKFGDWLHAGSGITTGPEPKFVLKICADLFRPLSAGAGESGLVARSSRPIVLRRG